MAGFSRELFTTIARQWIAATAKGVSKEKRLERWVLGNVGDRGLVRWCLYVQELGREES